MARRRKPGGRLRKGPFEFKDLDRAIRRDGWFPVDGTKHENYKHTSKPGKVSLDEKWTGVKYGHEMFRSIARQASLTPKELLQLLNE